MKFKRNNNTAKLLMAILFRFVVTEKTKKTLFSGQKFHLNFTNNSTFMRKNENSSHHNVPDFHLSQLNFPTAAINASTSFELDFSINLQQKMLQHITLSTVDPSPSYVLRQIPMNFMMTLYKYKSGIRSNSQREISEKWFRALKKSDIVRSFEIVESYLASKSLNLVFDTSAILFKEKIKLAELRIERKADLKQIELWDERKVFVSKKPTLIRRKIGSIRPGRNRETYKTTTNSSFSFDVTRILRRWYNSNFRKRKTPDTAKRSHNKKVKVELRERRRQQRSLPEANAMLLVYIQNKNIELFDVATARQDRNRRASNRYQKKRGVTVKRKKSRRKNRKRNRTQKVFPVNKRRHNEVEMVFEESEQGFSFTNELETSSFTNSEETHKSGKEEIEDWEQEQSEVLRNKKQNSDQNEPKHIVVTHTEHVVVPTVLPMTAKPINTIKQTHCRKIPYTIDFEAIGWDNWILYPLQFNAYRCVGECSVPHLITGESTNHAYIQSALSNNPYRNVPEPCCVPSELESLEILYYENGIVKQKVHEGMIVRKCECV